MAAALLLFLRAEAEALCDLFDMFVRGLIANAVEALGCALFVLGVISVCYGLALMRAAQGLV